MALLDIDPLSGAIETMEYDPIRKGLTITRTENVDALLDANTNVANDHSQRWRGADNDFWFVARVSMTTLYEWLQEYNKDKAPADRVKSPFDTSNDGWTRFQYGRLNSSDYRKLKTAPVTI